MHNKRIISAIIGLALLIGMFLAGEIYVSITITIVSMTALYEFFKATEYINKNIYLIIASNIITLIIGLSITYIEKQYFMPLIILYIIVLFIINLIYNKNIKITDIALVFFITIYISYFLSHITLTRALEKGEFLVWFIFLGAWLTDTFAYFVGIGIGKRKLCPNISPKKTIEGSIGGIVGCSLGFFLYAYLIEKICNYNINYINLFLLALLASIISQIGDLLASLIKRQYKIKDFGYIMPGHGGLLDRFDSIILLAPIVYYFFLYFNIIG